jgi:type IV pilus assembly protein PilE
VARDRQILSGRRGDRGPEGRIARGFTLIDVMVTVAILGILSVIAFFSFGDSVVKSKRAECKSALLAVASAQEQFLTSNSTYAGTLAALNLKAYSGNTAGSSACLLTDPTADPNQPAPLVAGTMNSFIATATSQFTDSTCGQAWTINNLGQKTPNPAATPPGACW